MNRYATEESCSTPNGRLTCELLREFYYGSKVYSVHVLEANDEYVYKETHRSYPTGNKKKALITYKQYCNMYLRNKIK